MTRHPDDRLTTADIEREYGVKQSTVWQWRHRGVLRPIGRLSGRGSPWLFRRHDVEQVLAQRRGGSVSG